MPDFRYEGINRSGKKERGVIAANHLHGAAAALREKGIVPLSVKEKNALRPGTAPGFGSVTVQRLAEFTRKFAVLTKTDIPISEIFEILAEEDEGFLLPEASKHVAREISLGAPLGKAMSGRPRVFSPLYIRMIEAGMNSGTLDLVAENLAKVYEAETELRKQMISKLTYPAILLVLCFALTVVLKLIPGYFGADITFISNELFALMMMFWLTIVGLVIFGMTRPGYRIYREIGLRIPIIGTLMRNINLGRFCRIFGLQYAAGVPVLEGLEVSKQVLQDGNLSKAVDNIQKRISGGMDLREAMIATRIFPGRMVSMIGTGERAGGVDKMLEKLAEYYDLDIQTQTTILTTIMYFVVYMTVAFTVIAVVISAWKGYFSIYDQFLE